MLTVYNYTKKRNILKAARRGKQITVGPKSADNPTIHVDFATHPHLSSGF
jgi:hypothetical protein